MCIASSFNAIIVTAEACHTWATYLDLSNGMVICFFVTVICFIVELASASSFPFCLMYLIKPTLYQKRLRCTEVSNYRTITLLCDLLNEKYCRFIIPGIKSAITCCAIICIVIAIRIDHIGSLTKLTLVVIQVGFLVIAIYCIGMTIIGANLFSELYHASFEWFSKKGKLVDKEHAKQICRSLRTLKIQIGGLYTKESHAKLTLIDFIISGIVNLLLVFK